MGGAGQARVEGADGHFDMVQQPFCDLAAGEVGLRHPPHGTVHGLVIVGGGDDEVGTPHLVVLVHLVMVDKGAARRLDPGDAFAAPRALGAQLRALEIIVEQQLLDLLRAMNQHDEPGPVIGEGGMDRLAAALGHEIPPRRLGAGGVDGGGAIDLGQRAHPVPSVLAAELAQMREFQIAPGANLLDEVVAVGGGRRAFDEGRALGIDHPQGAIIKVHDPIGPHKAHKGGGEGGEAVVQHPVLRHIGLVMVERCHAPGDDLAHLGAQGVAVFHGEVLVHPAGYGAGGMDLAPAGGLDDLLAELADEDRPLADLRITLEHCDDVTLLRWRIKAEQKVGRGEVEDVQRVGLQQLPIMHEPAHLLGGGRHLIDAGHLVHGFRRRQMVAHRADAAQALDDEGHLPVHPALDEPLEAAELHDVEARILHLAGLVQADGDLAVALHAGHRIDDDLAGGGGAVGGAHGAIFPGIG